MTAQAGTAVWFAQHESRLAWRDWLSMITAGRRERLRKVAIGIAAFIVFMHFVAYWVVGRYADAVVDKQTLVAITASVLLSWLLMISQAMESITRAFYARSDLDLILASPVATNKLFGVRIATVALATTMMALPLAAPFIDVLIALGGWRWLGAYGLIVAMGAAATALAVGLTVALFRVLGAKRTRFVAQVVAAVIGAAFVIGLQVAAILSYGTISRSAVLQSDTLLALAPGMSSVLWWPARAALGELLPLMAVLAVSLALLAAAIAIVAPRFGEYAIAAAGVSHSGAGQARRSAGFGKTSPRGALRRKEWILLRRDPWLMSQTLMQMLYLVPPALMLWRSFGQGNGALQVLVPVLVMAAGQLAGGLAWLAISGEDAPDLVATAPVPSRFILRAKIEAVLGAIAMIFAPLVAVLAIASPRHARSPAPGSSPPPRPRPPSSSGSAARPSAASFAAVRFHRGWPLSRKRFRRSAGPAPRRSPPSASGSASLRPCSRFWCSAGAWYMSPRAQHAW